MVEQQAHFQMLRQQMAAPVEGPQEILAEDEGGAAAGGAAAAVVDSGLQDELQLDAQAAGGVPKRQ